MEPIRFDPQGIAEQRAVCDAATPGPWTCEAWGIEANGVMIAYANTSDEISWSEQDADFVSAASTAYPAALTEIERLQPFEAECAALREQLASMTAERDAAHSSLRAIASGADICIACQWMADKGPEYPCSKQADWCGGASWEMRKLRTYTMRPCADNAPEGAESEGDIE